MNQHFIETEPLSSYHIGRPLVNCTGWPQSHAPMLIKKVIVVTFIQIQSSLQGLQMLDMFTVCSYARANRKFKVPVDTI